MILAILQSARLPSAVSCAESPVTILTGSTGQGEIDGVIGMTHKCFHQEALVRPYSRLCHFYFFWNSKGNNVSAYPENYTPRKGCSARTWPPIRVSNDCKVNMLKQVTALGDNTSAILTFLFRLPQWLSWSAQ